MENLSKTKYVGEIMESKKIKTKDGKHAAANDYTMNIRLGGITEEELKIKKEREEAATPTPSVLQAMPGTPVMDPPSVEPGKKPHDEVNLDNNPAPQSEAVPERPVASTLLDESDKDDQTSDKGDEDKDDKDDQKSGIESEELSSLADPIDEMPLIVPSLPKSEKKDKKDKKEKADKKDKDKEKKSKSKEDNKNLKDKKDREPSPVAATAKPKARSRGKGKKKGDNDNLSVKDAF